MEHQMWCFYMIIFGISAASYRSSGERRPLCRNNYPPKCLDTATELLADSLTKVSSLLAPDLQHFLLLKRQVDLIYSANR